MDLFTLKLLLLLFWTLWMSLVFLTNAFEGLKVLGALPERWKFASENYTAIAKATAIYSVPGWLNRLFFAGVLLWQAAAVVLFWSAFFRWWGAGQVEARPLAVSFAMGLALWAAFMLADEIFRDYQAQTTHLLIFTAQLVTLVAVLVLPG